MCPRPFFLQTLDQILTMVHAMTATLGCNNIIYFHKLSDGI